ncbi:MAG: hypothetical protein EHM39_12540 [Chloroflexi bacterium]|nr:MAG: hypothetical protein EHM39_12540 [Chloroflexota bacterium]
MTADSGERETVFTWTPFEGAEGYIFSIDDAEGEMLTHSAVMLPAETTTHSYSFEEEDLGRGPFTALVRAWAETEGNICIAEAGVDFGTADAGVCAGIDVTPNVVPGDERLVVLEWTAIPDAAEYQIHIYALDPDDGSRIGIRVLTAPGDTNTLHVGADMLPDDYNQFEFRIEARGEGHAYLCSGSATVDLPSKEGPVHWGAEAGG